MENKMKRNNKNNQEEKTKKEVEDCCCGCQTGKSKIQELQEKQL